MTPILLDTQALLWWLADDSRLGPEARTLMAREALLVSTASLWEVAIKAGLGKLAADVAEIGRAADAEGMQRLPITDTHLAAYQVLPQREGHRDPFDRMLVAQASVEGVSILTADRKLRDYAVETIQAAL